MAGWDARRAASEVLLFSPGPGLSQVVLMLLGVSSLLAGSYVGVANVDPTVVDVARAMGMTEARVLLCVEVLNALPLMLGRAAQRGTAGSDDCDGVCLREPGWARWLSD